MNINRIKELAGIFEEDNEYPEGHTLGHGRKEDLDYIEKELKGKIDRVTVVLSGQESAMATKLIKKFNELDKSIKAMTKARGEINKDLKEFTVSLFDAEDEILTRVVDTISATLTVGKKETRTPGPNIQYSKLMDAIYLLVLDLMPELHDKIKELEEQYTEFGKPGEISPKLSVKMKKESINEDLSDEVGDIIRQISDLFKSKIDRWTKRFDKKLEEIYEII